MKRKVLEDGPNLSPEYFHKRNEEEIYLDTEMKLITKALSNKN
ncbi:hypothetical protein MJO29_000470 [Puccinia striiformis f. sp. tritici]|nr:hypothetical protein MJO29_000470 [Puccinia striiformis f. sp. tritici]